MNRCSPREAASLFLFYAWAAADGDSTTFLLSESNTRICEPAHAQRYISEYLILRIWLSHLTINTSGLEAGTARTLSAEFQLQNAILCGFANRLAGTPESIRVVSEVEAHLTSAISELRAHPLSEIDAVDRARLFAPSQDALVARCGEYDTVVELSQRRAGDLPRNLAKQFTLNIADGSPFTQLAVAIDIMGALKAGTGIVRGFFGLG